MRRRSVITIALLALLGGVGSVAHAARTGGNAGARQPRNDVAVVHRVQPELAQAAAPSAAPSARALSLATDATAAALFTATLWALFNTFLLVPAGSFVRPTRRRRAPPLLVA